jgi:integrase
MPRHLNRLSSTRLKTLPSGRHHDGGGLYLVVDEAGARRWVFRYRREGKLKDMGLGPLSSRSLAKAREKAQAARELLADGQDPIAAKQADREVPTFAKLAEEVIEARRADLRSPKQIRGWERSLTVDAAALAPKKVDAITTDDVVKVLRPIWEKKPETASRTRARIEFVLAAAKARGFRTGENPALWRGHLSQLLPRRKRLSRGHFKALKYRELPAFVRRLRSREGVAARALEFTILTVARTSETRLARWGEFDLVAKVWTVPGERTKTGREHRVPLVPTVLAILDELKPLAAGEDGQPDPTSYVFPGLKRGKPISDGAMERVLDRMKVEATVHGMRSSFRDWAGDETTTAREVVEAAMSHVVGDAAEQAYRRGDALERRRKLMLAWSRYIDAPPKLKIVGES